MSKEEDPLERLESKIDQLPDTLERREQRMFYRGLIMGLILGILGNLFVSYWMEYLKAFDISFLGWAVSTAGAFLAIWYLIRRLEKESRR